MWSSPSVATNVVISGHQWSPMWSSVAISATWSIKEPKARAIVTPRPLGPLTSPRDRIHVRTPCLDFLASEGIQSSEPFVDVGHRRPCGESARRGEHMHAGQSSSLGLRRTCGESARRGEHMHAGQSCSLGLRRTLTGRDADGLLWMNGAINGNQWQSMASTGNQGRSHLARARRRWPLDECRRVRRPPNLIRERSAPW